MSDAGYGRGIVKQTRTRKQGKNFGEYLANILQKSIDFYLLKQYYITCVVTHAEVSELADEQD